MISSIQFLFFGAARHGAAIGGAVAFGIAENTRCSTDVFSMLVHRPRRWPNIEPSLVERLVFAGLK